jgi:hypothetical protein
MSKIVQRGIRVFSKQLRHQLYQPQTPTLHIATNAVIHPAAAAETQSHHAIDLGKRLLRASVQKDRSWVDENLRFTLFSTHHEQPHLSITPNNFPAIAYASSRIMHAWELPAWIDGKPYVDAAYTCLCPAMAMSAAGYQQTIAISNEPGILYQDMFHIDRVPSHHHDWAKPTLRDRSIHIIRPDVHLKQLGVEFTKATPDGLISVYQHGRLKGLEFLSQWQG